MKARTSPSFWKAYNNLDSRIKRQARKAFALWRENPFHPSLRFKCINTQENIWSARVTQGYRALGIVDEETITWFWIGKHDDYKQFYGG